MRSNPLAVLIQRASERGEHTDCQTDLDVTYVSSEPSDKVTIDTLSTAIQLLQWARWEDDEPPAEAPMLPKAQAFEIALSLTLSEEAANGD